MKEQVWILSSRKKGESKVGKRVRQCCIVVLVVLLVWSVLALLLSWVTGGPQAFYSPVSPIPLPTKVPERPDGLENCPSDAIENYAVVGYATCRTWIVMNRDLDVAPEYISGCALGWSQLGDLCEGYVSPLRDSKPYGLENCPYSCIELREKIGYPTCNTSRVVGYKLQVDKDYITGCVEGWVNLPDDLCVSRPISTPIPDQPGPEPTPVPTPVPEDEYLMSELWMGRYRMWTNGYRITRVEYP